ncbi:MAG: hypothetical protein ABW250_03610 [Pyrinomonadaceae bacterium]
MSYVETVNPVAAAARPESARWRQTLTWAGAATLAVPAAILLHEAGHLLAHVWFGFADSTLHYSSATYGVEKAFWQQVNAGNLQAAASLVPLRQAAASIAAGLFVTYALVIVCCCAAARFRPHPALVALGLASLMRFPACLPLLFKSLAGRPLRSGADEVHLATLTGIPPALLLAAGLLTLVVGVLWLARTIPRQTRGPAFAGLAAGLAVGLVLYLSLLGPWLLP